MAPPVGNRVTTCEHTSVAANRGEMPQRCFAPPALSLSKPSMKGPPPNAATYFAGSGLHQTLERVNPLKERYTMPDLTVAANTWSLTGRAMTTCVGFDGEKF